jgi:hypothetical protein
MKNKEYEARTRIIFDLDVAVAMAIDMARRRNPARTATRSQFIQDALRKVLADEIAYCEQYLESSPPANDENPHIPSKPPTKRRKRADSDGAEN